MRLLSPQARAEARADVTVFGVVVGFLAFTLTVSALSGCLEPAGGREPDPLYRPATNCIRTVWCLQECAAAYSPGCAPSCHIDVPQAASDLASETYISCVYHWLDCEGKTLECEGSE